MAGRRGGPLVNLRGRRIAAVVLGMTALAILTVVEIVVLSPVRTTISGETLERDTTVTLTTTEASADIPLTLGWSYRPALWDTSRVTLHSPDGQMNIELQLTRDVDPAETARAVTSAPIDAFDTEPLGDATLLHARVDDDTLVGALTQGKDVLVFVSTPSPAYDAELASLLSKVRFVS